MKSPDSRRVWRPMAAVCCDSLRFQYPGESFALRLPRFDAAPAESVAILGPSGCGKTTLLRLISGILPLHGGRVEVAGEVISAMNFAARQRFRITRIGLVFQEFELLDYLTARENVLLPFRISDALTLDAMAERRADELMEETGIAALSGRRPGELSQGERQRVALCRALVTHPSLILADEPTGSLDPENQARSVALLR
ncbi:MAG: ATP-binding cassette domain-containing protein, partial [Verrucomicrobiae bacterium]|nr:ATP-binding cassette domain-containing protein [Verrucomicrobiae bacterium]